MSIVILLLYFVPILVRLYFFIGWYALYQQTRTLPIEEQHYHMAKSDNLYNLVELLSLAILLISFTILIVYHLKKTKQNPQNKRMAFLAGTIFILCVFSAFSFETTNTIYKTVSYAEVSKNIRLLQSIPYLLSPVLGIYWFKNDSSDIRE